MKTIRKLTLVVIVIAFVAFCVRYFDVIIHTIANNVDQQARLNYPEDLLFYVETVNTFRHRKLKELEIKEKYAKVSDIDLEKLSKMFRRNITLQSNQPLLPKSNDIASTECFLFSNFYYNIKVSILIIFKDEFIPLLLRTLTTIVHRTLPRYLHEIILIDDFSLRDNAYEIKEYCVLQNIPFKYERNEVALGIVNSRLKGIKMASAEVIVVLDSHIEVMDFWLEPLLDIIKKHPNGIALPCLRMRSESNDEFFRSEICKVYDTYIEHGYGMINIGFADIDVDYKVTDHTKSSALMGGAFAASREFMLRVYPEPVIATSWGIENSRLSVRSWLCGDGIYMNGCSQLVHTNCADTSLRRYFDNEPGNYGRLMEAESVGEILNFMRYPEERKSFLLKVFAEKEYADLAYKYSHEIKKKFDPQQYHCRDYSFYLEKVMSHYVSYDRTQFLQVGEMQSALRPDLCIEMLSFKIGTYLCRENISISDNHILGFAINGGIRISQLKHMCLDIHSAANCTEISVYPCHTMSTVEDGHSDSQKFKYDAETEQIIHTATNLCFEITSNLNIVACFCDKNKVAQRWLYKKAPWF